MPCMGPAQWPTPGVPSRTQGTQGLGVMSLDVSCFGKSYEDAVAFVPNICQSRRQAERGESQDTCNDIYLVWSLDERWMSIRTSPGNFRPDAMEAPIKIPGLSISISGRTLFACATWSGQRFQPSLLFLLEH
jgi:hypothetical protein